MAKDFAKQFYKTKAWKNTAKLYLKKQRGWCEECIASGIFTEANIVHHKIELTPQNIVNPDIALDFENLEAVCRSCHLKLHGAKSRRYQVDEAGRVNHK